MTGGDESDDDDLTDWSTDYEEDIEGALSHFSIRIGRALSAL